jgi:hypothetical protein
MTDVRAVSRDGNPPSKSSLGDIEARSDGQTVTYLANMYRARGVANAWCMHFARLKPDEVCKP